MELCRYLSAVAVSWGAVTAGPERSLHNYAKPIRLADLHRSVTPMMAHHAAHTSRLLPVIENRRAAQHPVGRQALAPWLREWDSHAQGLRQLTRYVPHFASGLGSSYNQRLKDVHHGFHRDLERTLHDDKKMKQLHEEWKKDGHANGRLSGIAMPAKPDTREHESQDKKQGTQ